MRPDQPPNPDPIPNPPPITTPPPDAPTQPEVPYPPTGPEVVPPSIPEKPDLPPTPRNDGESEEGGNAFKWAVGADDQRDLVLEGDPTDPRDAEPQ